MLGVHVTFAHSCLDSADKANTVADLRGDTRDAPPGSKFFQFHAVFGEIWQNCMLAPLPPESWRPLLGEILDPPLEYMYKVWAVDGTQTQIETE